MSPVQRKNGRNTSRKNAQLTSTYGRSGSIAGTHRLAPKPHSTHSAVLHKNASCGVWCVSRSSSRRLR